MGPEADAMYSLMEEDMPDTASLWLGIPAGHPLSGQCSRNPHPQLWGVVSPSLMKTPQPSWKGLEVPSTAAVTFV